MSKGRLAESELVELFSRRLRKYVKYHWGSNKDYFIWNKSTGKWVFDKKGHAALALFFRALRDEKKEAWREGNKRKVDRLSLSDRVAYVKPCLAAYQYGFDGYVNLDKTENEITNTAVRRKPEKRPDGKEITEEPSKERRKKTKRRRKPGTKLGTGPLRRKADTARRLRSLRKKGR